MSVDRERRDRWRRMVVAQEAYLRALAADSALWDPAKLRSIADAMGFVLDAGALMAEWADDEPGGP